MEQEAALITGPEMPQGRPLSARDLEVQARIFGGLTPDDEDAIALRDARGHQFQRLEWLGDAILDLLAAQHRAYAAALTLDCCLAQEFETSDRTLGMRAIETDIASIADWNLSWHRAADLAEATVGAAFRAFAWAGARKCGAVLHFPLGVEPTLDAPPAVSRRAAAALGAQVFDTTVSIDVYSERPDDAEGALSELRAHRIRNRVRADIADAAQLRQTATTIEGMADDLDEAIGGVCLEGGLAHAITITRALIRSHT